MANDWHLGYTETTDFANDTKVGIMTTTGFHYSFATQRLTRFDELSCDWAALDHDTAHS